VVAVGCRELLFTRRIEPSSPPTACTAHPDVSAGRYRPEAAVTGAVKIPDTLVLHPQDLTRPGGFPDAGECDPASASTCCAAEPCAGCVLTYRPHRSRTSCMSSYLPCTATSPRRSERPSLLPESLACAARPTSRCPHTSTKLAYVTDGSRERHCIQVIDERVVASPCQRDRCFGRSTDLSDRGRVRTPDEVRMADVRSIGRRGCSSRPVRASSRYAGIAQLLE